MFTIYSMNDEPHEVENYVQAVRYLYEKIGVGPTQIASAIDPRIGGQLEYEDETFIVIPASADGIPSTLLPMEVMLEPGCLGCTPPHLHAYLMVPDTGEAFDWKLVMQ